MPKYSTWVVKLGGAMMGEPELREWLAACNQPAASVRCIVIAGGGRFADHVRALQDTWAFSDGLAHHLAIEGMALNARILASIEPGARVFSELDPAALGRGRARCWIWQPQAPFSKLSLPHSWDVSADSIAFRVAELMAADALMLVKSPGAAVFATGNAEDFAERGVVDRLLPSLVRNAGVPTSLLSKFDHADFAAACRTGVSYAAPLTLRASAT